jgi:hypothetical protein
MLLVVPLWRGRWLPTVGILAINVVLLCFHYWQPRYLEAIYWTFSVGLLVFFLAMFAPEVRALRRPLRD